MNGKQIVYNSKLHPSITILRKTDVPIENPNEQVAKKVIAGAYGVGEARKQKLAAEGYDPTTIQSIVNEMVNKTYVQKSLLTTILMPSETISVLQSMTFTLSINDISGSFSLTFFPEIKKGKETVSLYDLIKVLDIVEIVENGKPVFTGIVKRKNYVAQANDTGGLRRISISGTAITGLVSQFLVNLDTAAMAITNQIASDVSLSKDLTLKMLSKKNLSVSDVIKTIWNYFVKISSQNGTPKVAEYIVSELGGIDSFFKFDDSTFFYPLGCVFNGQQTQDFFSVVDGVIPSPVYEKFAYCDDKGMKIMIRQVPFDSDKWNGGATPKPTVHKIDSKIVKGLSLALSDNEVYTVFYAYLNNSPIDERKGLLLSTMENKKDNILVDSDKYKTYGYRPMIAHFIGYGLKDGEKDDVSQSKMEEISGKLKEWYENLPEMLSGSITLSMTDVLSSNDKNKPFMPGDVVKFLNGEFYVEGITHSWNYGSGGEINLSVGRGGKYTNGKFNGEIPNLTSLVELMQRGISVKEQ